MIAEYDLLSCTHGLFSQSVWGSEQPDGAVAVLVHCTGVGPSGVHSISIVSMISQ